MFLENFAATDREKPLVKLMKGLVIVRKARSDTFITNEELVQHLQEIIMNLFHIIEVVQNPITC